MRWPLATARVTPSHVLPKMLRNRVKAQDMPPSHIPEVFMSMLRLIPLLALAASFQALAAQDVELKLRSGAVVKGTLVSEDDDKVVVKSTAIGKSGKAMSMTMPYKRTEIAEVIALADPEETYKTKSAAAKSAADQLALAQWCREQARTEQAIEHAKKAVELDATVEAAVTLATELGWVRVDGKWVKEADALAAQGKVRVQGKIMTLAEADALKANAKNQAAAADAQRATDEKAGTIALLDRQLADLKKRPALIDAEQAKANADLASAQGLAQRLTSAKSNLDSAQKSLDQARAQNQNAPNGGNNPGNNANNNLLPLTQAVENAQKELNAARRDAGNADSLVAQAKAKIAALTEEKKTLEKKTLELTAKRDAAAKALEQAKAAGNDAGKSAPTAK